MRCATLVNAQQGAFLVINFAWKQSSEIKRRIASNLLKEDFMRARSTVLSPEHQTAARMALIEPSGEVHWSCESFPGEENNGPGPGSSGVACPKPHAKKLSKRALIDSMSDKARIKRGIGQRRKWVPNPIQYPQKLPISKRHDEIVEAIRRHPVIILSGETGSGRPPRFPKCASMPEEDENANSLYATSSSRRPLHSQTSLGRIRKSNTARSRLKIRFSDKTSQETRIKFPTDGMLLAEIQSDPSMSEYDTIIIDEAHERSLNIDFLLGHLNQLRKRHSTLRSLSPQQPSISKNFLTPSIAPLLSKYLEESIRLRSSTRHSMSFWKTAVNSP